MKTVLACSLMLFQGLLNAQVKRDSVLTLPEVVKQELVEQGNVQKVDAEAFKYSGGKSLSSVLSAGMGLFFRNYGNGQLSSISFRGTNAAQTDLLWNGVKLNSPTLGQIDASLFNLGIADRVEFSGSNQNNIGGHVSLYNNETIDTLKSLEVELSYGSFQTLNSFGKATYGDGKLSGSTRVNYFRSENNYLFKNTYREGQPKQKLTNAKVELMSFIQQFSAKVNETNSILFYLWLSDAHRLIPPIISKPIGRESQDDYSIRSMLTWKGVFKGFSTKLTNAILMDVIRYQNPEIYLDQKSKVHALRNNFLLSYDKLRNILIAFEAGYDYEWAIVPAFETTRVRHISTLVGRFNYSPVKDFLISLNLRQCIYDKSLSPFSPSLSLRYSKPLPSGHYLVWSAKATRTFRFPTLNDLYWVQGGNLNLKAEKGIDGEVSMTYSYHRYFSFTGTGYCKYIQNWIQWIPNGPYWEAQNVKLVLTRGVETAMQVENPFPTSVKDFHLKLRIGYTYIRATNLTGISIADQSKGKQLIFVPVHMASLNLHIDYKNFFARASNHFTGEVYISTDNSNSLASFYLLDIEAGKDFRIKNLELGAMFKIWNVTNSNYQTVAQRPMPGRSFEGALRFKLK